MEIIPVIDIRQGQVVRAVRGLRQNYLPLQTSLCQGHSPENMVQSFIKLYPFKKIYIADLDAIEGQSNNELIIERLHDKFQSQIFWVDQGLSSTFEIKKLLDRKHVIGSETNISPDILLEISSMTPDIVLSLDYRSKLFLGDKKLLQNMEVWPEKIIIMSLANIGSKQGPDYELIYSLRKHAANKKIYIAGGIRHEKDLHALNNIGIDGVLVATALHTQQIKIDSIIKFS